MMHYFPNYYHQFRCLAGSCPRSCCIGWEVEIDEDTAAAYAAVPGSLGDELRCSLQQDSDGALCFPLNGARCPFLDDENLCRIHRTLGAEYTSLTCREHPRFTEDFGTVQETSLSASCPEAARLLLEGSTPLTFLSEELPDTGGDAEEDPWLAPLLAVRDFALKLMGDPSQPVSLRMARVLLLALHAQTLLDEDCAEDLPFLCGVLPELPDCPPDTGKLFPAFWNILSQLEILEDDWLPLLQTAQTDCGSTDLTDLQLERLTEYFLFRWMMKSINDGDLLGRVQLSIASALTVAHLCVYTTSPEEALYRYCREIEHSEENIEELLERFRWEEALQPDVFLCTLENV